MEPNRQWFTIDVTGFDAAEIERRIINRMLERSPDGFILHPAATHAIQAFEESVDQLRGMLESLSVQVSVRDERIPIANAAWNRVKAQFHALTVLYVNELAGKQTVINNQIVESLDVLVTRLNIEAEQQERRVGALEIEIARLQEQVLRLSQKRN